VRAHAQNIKCYVHGGFGHISTSSFLVTQHIIICCCFEVCSAYCYSCVLLFNKRKHTSCPLYIFCKQQR